MVLHDGGHVAERKGCARDPVDGNLGEVGWSDDGKVVLDGEALVGCVDEAARTRSGCLQEGQRRNPQSIARRTNHLLERHLLVSQLLWIDEHLKLALTLTPDGHVGYTGHRKQAWPDREAGQNSKLDGTQLLGGQRHHCHSAARGPGLEHLRRL